MKINIRIKFLLFLIPLVLIVNFGNLKCELDLTKNKEFILTFLPNYHNNWYSNSQRLFRGDSIYIFIYAALPTQGTIEYKDIYGASYIENFNIPDPNIVYIFKRPSYDYALRGFNLSGTINDNTHSEKIVDFSFKVKADYPVQVYGHSQAVLTSESFNVLPIESLGNEYLILAYNSNVTNSTGEGQRTPSQFAVVASEDSTEVTIIPSVPTRYNNLDTQKIILNAGQVYLVQSDIFGFDPDLSKSIVRSNKPVAVFSGQQRTRIPNNIVGDRISRDYIVEQMPPLDSWSNEAIVVPFPAPSYLEPSNNAFDQLRVIAAYDNTELYVNDILLATLNQAEIYETDLTIPMHIKANAPIMAAGYKRSSGITNNFNSNNYRGDPLLQIIPTPNQYGESYRFITIQSYETDGPGSVATKIYDEHNIAVIAEPENIPTIFLDGVPVNPLIFKPVQGSSYRYAHIRISEGTHQMVGERAFGLFVCGYGNANSYGYFCGVVSKRDDYEPPVLQSSSSCYEIEGFATDQKLKSINAPLNQINNVQVDIEKFNPYVTEAKFSAKLINNLNDGRFRITAIDSVGQQTSKDIDIPGFTVALKNGQKMDSDTPISTLTDSMGVKERKCYDYTLINYGKFNQNIKLAELQIKNPKISINLPSNFQLAPKGELDFSICFESDESDHLIDSLFISDDCYTRKLLAIDLQSSKDENEPQVAAFKDPCNQYFDLIISDSLRTDTGIDTIIVEIANNLDIKIKKLASKTYSLSAKVKNQMMDSYIKIIVRDLAGYETVFERAVPGFTLNFEFVNYKTDSTMYFDFGKRMVGIRYCDSVKLKNYGENELYFDNVRLNSNLWFSLPPSQLPLILKPGEEKSVRICYFSNSNKVKYHADTLNVSFNCIDKEIVLLGQPDSLIFGNDSKCDIPLIFEVDEVPSGSFISGVYPNPSGGIVNIQFSNNKSNKIVINVFNQLGESVKILNFDNLDAGFYSIPLDMSQLNNGSYYIRVSIGNFTDYLNVLLVK